MPFPWLQADIPTSYQATFRQKALDMYRSEVRQRAALLLHLGYSAKEATARCRASLRWEFDMNGGCGIEDEVPKLVQAVYKREKKG